MRNLLLAASTSLLMAGGAVPASAHAVCDGDFQMINGSWVATRACQFREAQKVAQEKHERISESSNRQWYESSPEEFCRGNPDIRVSTFCAEYKD